MFIERLSAISQRIDGSLALTLVAPDGIPVESYSSSSDLPLDALAAELVDQVGSISENHRELSVGDVRLFAVETDDYAVMVSSVGRGYHLLLVLAGDGNRGQARYELRRARLLLEPDLI